MAIGSIRFLDGHRKRLTALPRRGVRTRADPHVLCASCTPAVEITVKNACHAWPGCCPRLGMTQLSSEALTVLDLSVIEAMRSLGEADVFAEIAHMFLEDVPPDLSALGAALASGSAASVAQIAHSLRGNALGIGAIRMVPVCAAIEFAARAGSLARRGGVRPPSRARVRGDARGLAGAHPVMRTRGRPDADSRPFRPVAETD